MRSTRPLKYLRSFRVPKLHCMSLRHNMLTRIVHVLAVARRSCYFEVFIHSEDLPTLPGPSQWPTLHDFDAYRICLLHTLCRQQSARRTRDNAIFIFVQCHKSHAICRGLSSRGFRRGHNFEAKLKRSSSRRYDDHHLKTVCQCHLCVAQGSRYRLCACGKNLSNTEWVTSLLKHLKRIWRGGRVA